MESRFDVVVIGGGHNGLACAAYLARAGRSVVLLEARDQVGGCASTVDAVGARVNICNCDHIMVRATPLIEELELERHGLRYLEVDPTYLNLTWDAGPPWLSYRDPDRTADQLARQRPSDGAAYRRYLRAALPAARMVAALAGGAPRLRSVLPQVRASGVGAARTILAWCRRSALDVLGSFFDTDRLITPALATGPGVWGVAPDAPGTGLAGLGYALRHVVGVGRPQGGSGTLTDALRAAFEAAGGEVRCATPARRVLYSEDGVGAVLTERGTISTRAVVGAIDPRTVDELCGQTPEPGPEPEGFESKIDAVVGELPRYTALETSGIPLDRAVIPTAVITPTADEVVTAARLRAAGQVPPRPMMLVNLPSVLDPTMRPSPDTHLLSLEVLWTPYSLAGGWEHSREPRRWLERYATLIQPGFLDQVATWRVMTPPDYEQQFGLRKGYAPSFPGSPLDALRGRPRRLARYRTDIAGLYLTGAGTYPGAGIWGASGRNTAHTVLADLGEG